jgi:5-methylcytosine-specific restriction protein B
MAESLRFAAVYGAAGTPDLDDVLDLIAMQKLLPRLHGSRRRLEPVLQKLIEWAGPPDSVLENQSPVATVGPRLPSTAAKLQRMLASLQANQFVSFTE